MKQEPSPVRVGIPFLQEGVHVNGICLIVGNILYHYFPLSENTWEDVFERCWFQISTLLTVWLVCRKTDVELNKITIKTEINGKVTSEDIALAGLKSGDVRSVSLAFQLAGKPPCPKCGYVIDHCKCN